MLISYQKFASFRAIELNKDETKRTDNLLSLLNNPAQKEQAKLELFDIFDKHIQEEAVAKAGKFYHQDDFLQKLYLTFLESLETVKSLTTDKLLELLNNTKPNKDDIQEEYRFDLISIDKQINSEDEKMFGIFLSDDKILKPLSTASQEEREELSKKIKQLAEPLNPVEQDLLEQRASGKTYEKIANDSNSNISIIRMKIKSAIAKIQINNNTLPKDIEVFAEQFIKTFDLKLDKKEVINLLINNIVVVGYNIETLDTKVKTVSNFLEIDRKEFIQAALKQPSLFTQKPETIFNNTEKTSQHLEVDRKEFVQAALKQPQLFIQKPETISNNIDKTSKLLDVDRNKFIQAALIQPTLFCQKPETISNNIDKTSKLLAVDRSAFIKAALIQPTLFCRKPETISNNADKTSKLLAVDRSAFIQATLKQPSLFTQKPETIFNNVDKVSKLLDIDRIVFIKVTLKQPSLFCLKPENLAKKVNIIKYYKQIQGKNNDNVIFSTRSDKNLYFDILKYLIKSNDNIKSNLKESDIIKHLKSKNQVYNFEIPQNELANDFIKYVSEFSQSHFGKQIFKIIIK